MGTTAMWGSTSEPVANDRGRRVTLSRDGQAMSYRDVLSAWREDKAFAGFFGCLLAAMPFKGFRWETPSVTRGTIDQVFECVALDAPGVDGVADAEAFSTHFTKQREGIVTFPNLGGDAVLVVPAPVDAGAEYAHLAAFLRTAPVGQQRALWRAIGHAMEARLSDKPVWLGTAGMGVAWLHVRLDDRPKYYGYAPYRPRSFP